MRGAGMTLLEIIENVAQKIADSEAYLNELDAVMRDGEHASNMKKCFGAVREMLPSWQGQYKSPIQAVILPAPAYIISKQIYIC